MLTADVWRAVLVIQEHLGRSLVTGQVVLNFNNGDFSTYEVKEFCRVPPDLTPKKVVDKQRCCA